MQTINLEIKAIVAIALAAASDLPRLRARIEALGAEVDVGLLFKLEDYAHALLFVQGDSLFAVAPADTWLKPYERPGDPKAAMNEYLSWEIDLLARIERDGTTHFSAP